MKSVTITPETARLLALPVQGCAHPRPLLTLVEGRAPYSHGAGLLCSGCGTWFDVSLEGEAHAQADQRLIQRGIKLSDRVRSAAWTREGDLTSAWVVAERGDVAVRFTSTTSETSPYIRQRYRKDGTEWREVGEPTPCSKVDALALLRGEVG